MYIQWYHPCITSYNNDCYYDEGNWNDGCLRPLYKYIEGCGSFISSQDDIGGYYFKELIYWKKNDITYGDIWNGINENRPLQNLLNIYPNPSSGTLYLNASGIGTGNYTFSISDLNGRMILQKAITLSGQIETKEISVSSLVNGIYLCKLSGVAGIYTSKLTIAK
jgi:hypothetical protein